MNNIIICEHIGLFKPSIVYCNGKKLVTSGLDCETLVKTWQNEFDFYSNEPIIVVFSNKDYKVIQQKYSLAYLKSLKDLLEQYKVVCISKEMLENTMDFINKIWGSNEVHN